MWIVEIEPVPSVLWVKRGKIVNGDSGKYSENEEGLGRVAIWFEPLSFFTTPVLLSRLLSCFVSETERLEVWITSNRLHFVSNAEIFAL